MSWTHLPVDRGGNGAAASHHPVAGNVFPTAVSSGKSVRWDTGARGAETLLLDMYLGHC